MPTQRITREMVVSAAFEIARTSGMEQVMVKNIADRLGCSVQPIYSYCKNMDSLRQDVVTEVNRFLQEYLESHIDRNDLFRSTGKAYIRLAEEEPHLFRIFILHKRSGISSLNDLYRTQTNPHVAEYIAKDLNIGISQAKQLHLNMLIYTIGIGTIFSVTTPGISTNEIYT
ncbi:MAG: TetR/AcrR family transcriptional regulator, partial [Lachnospiraceae bacterium]|nr:TetR/AcrR family transcriptional regulator [Lachnospiraceae bacterium]